jgi:excisionase family DNA binding protein
MEDFRNTQMSMDDIARTRDAQPGRNEQRTVAQNSFVGHQHTAYNNGMNVPTQIEKTETTEKKPRSRKAPPVNTSPIGELQLITPEDIMLAMRLSRSSVYKLLKSGEIPTVKIGKMLRVNKSDFEHWLTGHTAAAHTE